MIYIVRVDASFVRWFYCGWFPTEPPHFWERLVIEDLATPFSIFHGIDCVFLSSDLHYSFLGVAFKLICARVYR